MKCRYCGSAKLSPMVDLGYAPPSNAYLAPEDLKRLEVWYPLRVNVCNECWLVQTEDYAGSSELFSHDYAYFSSTSESWLSHARLYCSQVTTRFGLGPESFVVELASNDGYLLRNFVAMGIPCLGIEPTAATADFSEKAGIPVMREFFSAQIGRQLASDGSLADLIIGNNVYAHVPDINDFTAGINTILAPGGVVTLEFPHVLEMLQHKQFDTIYHEHFSYLSLTAVEQIFATHGLRVWDVETLGTHGGSLRVYGCHRDDTRSQSERVGQMCEREQKYGITNVEVYRQFSRDVINVKDDFIRFLLDCKQQGLSVCGYGAAAKGNTLMNYAGIRPDMMEFICDAAPSKQGMFLPGSHIPILDPCVIRERQPDIVIVFPWNIFDEIAESLQYIAEWGGRLAVAVPQLRLV